MATIPTGTGGYRLEVERDVIDVTSGNATYRESWSYTDAAGHEHHYAPGFPTLRHVIDASHWCDGNEGLAPHDPHEQVDESHYECSQCGEIIEPDTDPPYTPKSIPGPTARVYLEGPHPDGSWVRALLSKGEAQALIDEWSDEAAAAVISQLDDERIVQRTYSAR